MAERLKVVMACLSAAAGRKEVFGWFWFFSFHLFSVIIIILCDVILLKVT